MATGKSLSALSSPHVHTQFCDGNSTAEAMVHSALERGFVSLGFSSHAKQDIHQEYSLNEAREPLYIQEIRRLQREYAGHLRIWLGVERDLISTAKRENFEYVIGAVHYVISPEGDKLPVDASAQLIRDIILHCYHGDGLRFAREYFHSYGAYIRDYKPDIIAHFDLINKYNNDGSLFDTSDRHYVKASAEAMDNAIKGCAMMEVNVGGIVRAGTKEPYPSLPLLRYWQAIGGQVILSSDCHLAEQLDSGYEVGLAHIRAAGYKKPPFWGGKMNCLNGKNWVNPPAVRAVQPDGHCARQSGPLAAGFAA
ncbi:MAG TPA: histidinol-phosphatase HisJ family protein [Clostridia bacterium]|nr:histidinol-phosphatase HisJ family protein [Clostridia bacterium]